MNAVVFDAQGQRIALGKELGKGGEGQVFALPSESDSVAKLYSKALPTIKQAKLRWMAQRQDPALSAFAAWPLRTLHAKAQGPVVGFLMRNVGARMPIHILYSPAHRKQEFPAASWEFLLWAARNTAAAFEALHDRGFVLGDVNQGNVMVGRDARVVLIDCDSFQIEGNGSTYLCEVGVPDFTPPELQGTSSFGSVKRTPNHDNFGLATMIFQLLCGGRHPYAGVPQRRDVGERMEDDIRTFRYAYAKDAAARAMAPPPGSIPISVLSEVMRIMFEAAFLESGVRQSRPTAKQWVSVLDAQRQQLRRCGNERIHIFPQHLLRCPWCELDAKGVVLFISADPISAIPNSGFILARAWAAIETVRIPQIVPLPTLVAHSVTPAPLPPGMITRAQWVGFVFIVGLVTLALCSGQPKYSWGFVIAAVIVSTIPNWNRARIAERKRRQTVHDAARTVYNTLCTQYRKEADPKIFDARKNELMKLRDEWNGLARRELEELANLKTTALERQKSKYLDGFFIETATIKGIGPAKKASLRSFGIETANDVEWSKIEGIHGFGPSLTSAVVAWRSGIERFFRFDPRTAVTPADETAVRNRIRARRSTIEATLLGAPSELMRLSKELSQRSSTILGRIKSAESAWNQARSDLSIV